MALIRSIRMKSGTIEIGLVALAVIIGTVLGFRGMTLIQDRTERSTGKVTEFEAFTGGAEGLRLLGAGWAEPEPWGIWTVGPTARLALKLKGRPASDVRVVIDARIFPFIAAVEQTVRISINGSLVAVVERNWEEGILGGIFYVPASVINAKQPVEFVFDVARPTSPKDVQLGGDTRKLGLGLKSITLEYQD